MVVAKLGVPPPPYPADLAQLDWDGEQVPMLLCKRAPTRKRHASSHVHLRQGGHVRSRDLSIATAHSRM